MKKAFTAVIFVSSLSVCPAQILKVDFTAYSWYSVKGYNYQAVPSASWDPYDQATVYGTFTYNTDSLHETFTQDALGGWKWQYQTPEQINLNIMLKSVNNLPDISYSNTTTFPYSTLTSFTEYSLALGYGSKVEKLNLSTRDNPFNSGIVKSLDVSFGSSVLQLDPLNPVEPLTVLDPAHYLVTPGPYYGSVMLGTTVYTTDGAYVGLCKNAYKILSCQVTVIPEPATLVLLAVGGMLIPKR
jgi:hypothetical protein